MSKLSGRLMFVLLLPVLALAGCATQGAVAPASGPAPAATAVPAIAQPAPATMAAQPVASATMAMPQPGAAPATAVPAPSQAPAASASPLAGTGPAVCGGPAAGCTPVAVGQSGSYYDVTPARLSAMLKAKNFPLINVHIPYFAELPNTDVFIPYDQITQQLSKLPADKNAPIVLYCRSGSMSTEASQELVKLGYTNVWNLAGGMYAWQAAGLPLLNKGQ